MTGAGSTYTEFLAVATAASEAADDVTPLAELGWSDVISQLDDPDARAAAFALFRAQGRALTTSRALGSLLAQPYLARTAIEPTSVVATAFQDSPDAGRADVLVGDTETPLVLVDRPGHGAHVVDLADAALVPIDIGGQRVAHRVDLDRSGDPTIGEDEAGAARRDSLAVGRLALAFEILGAAESVLELAVVYACDREQFGRPIGTFQAIRHLLASAETDRVALESVAMTALRFGGAAPANFDSVVKALAGRNGLRVCQGALQTFGGIGFTAEHDHHRFHDRVLFLDSLLGTSADLTHELGAWLRSSGTDPRYPAAVLGGPLN